MEPKYKVQYGNYSKWIFIEILSFSCPVSALHEQKHKKVKTSFLIKCALTSTANHGKSRKFSKFDFFSLSKICTYLSMD